jgi:hypothetical protein
MYLLNGLVTSWLNRPGLGQEAADVIEGVALNRPRSSITIGDLIMNCRAMLVHLIGWLDGQVILYQYAYLAIQGFLFVPSAQVVNTTREHDMGFHINVRLDR